MLNIFKNDSMNYSNNKLIYNGSMKSDYKFCLIFNLNSNKLIGFHMTKCCKKGTFIKKIINEFLKEYRLKNKYDIVNKIILDKIKDSICIIKTKDGKSKIGLFCYIKDKNENIPVLLINNYINNYFQNEINISINNKDKIIKIEYIIYKNETYKISIIKIKESDKDIKYIEIDDKIYENQLEKYYYNESIYIMQYNNSKDILISYGIIQEINNEKLIYTGNINSNYKFCPIFNLTNNKLIGFHKSKSKFFKNGVFLQKIMNEFIKEYRIMEKYYYYNNLNINISIAVGVGKEDINKEIYFLSNGNAYLKELNELNTEIYINNKNYEFKKYFIPEEEGEYQIYLKFSINLTDCSYMFSGCNKIIDIDFISFNTKNITDMKHMFGGCFHLKRIDFFSWDTANVTNISGMFSNCWALPNLPDISKWNTQNVKNMSSMFYDCRALNNIPDISKWNTKNVIDMNSMFYGCSSLKSLPDISNWDTKNVIDMSEIFENCSSLKELPDISKWNTQNVTKMNYMFYHCWTLNSLPNISKWNTQNVTNMGGMFDNCSSLKNMPDIFKWDIKKVSNMRYMFRNCTSLKNMPDISKWDIKNAKYKDHMFDN